MALQNKYAFESLDARQMLDSPELPQMLAALLELYRLKCRSEERQQETIQALLDRIYGRKSEKAKYHPNERLLFPELLEALNEELAHDAEAEPSDSADAPDGIEIEVVSIGPDSGEAENKPKRKGAHGRRQLPPHIERRVVERVDMDAPGCDACGTERPILRIEMSERLNYVPAKAIVDVTEVVIRGPLPCTCDEAAPKIVRPELPSRPIDRGMPGVELLNAVIIGKYLYHLPHYRQATKTLKDAGVTLSKQTLWDWTRESRRTMASWRASLAFGVNRVADYRAAIRRPSPVRHAPGGG